MILDPRRSQKTEAVLRAISRHLSSREDCRDVEYVVTIKADDRGETDRIVVSPRITVFPNIHDRKSSDRQSIAYHIIYNHFHELYKSSDSSFVHIVKDSLVHGNYMYKKFNLTSRRKWRRINSTEVSNG